MDNKSNKEPVAEMNMIIQVNKEYLEDFTAEIKELLEDTELELVNLQMDPENKDCINSIYCNFNAIKSLSGLINNPLCNKIAVLTEELINNVRKDKVIVTRNIINVVLDSVNIIKKICTEKADNIHITSEVEAHLQALSISNESLLKEIGYCEHENDGVVNQRKTPLDNSILREKTADAQDIIKSIRMQKIRNNQNNDQYVKIPLERLDQIIDMIQSVEKIYNSVKNEAALRFGSNDSLTVESTKSYYLINDVKSILKELRMVTFQQAFQRLTRSVCSFIEEKQLEVKFSTMGENVEVDKELADKIAAPLGDLIKLILDKADINVKDSRINNIEVLAYENNGLIHIDIISDMALNPEELKRESQYIEAIEKLNYLNCRAQLNLDAEGGIILSITSST